MDRLSMNPLMYGMVEENRFNAQAADSGYKRISTFYSDLSIAEWYALKGIEPNAVQDTYDRVCESWLSDYKMFTEFVLCLNWKSWEFYGENDTLGELYAELYYKASDLFREHFADNEEALTYYFNVTD